VAHAPSLPRDVLLSIARQAGERLSLAMLGLPAGSTLAIGESFPDFMLSPTAVSTPDAPFGGLVTDTGAWHHQIRHGASSVAFCRSRPNDASAGDHRVVSVIRNAAVACRIDAAIQWIDRNVPGDPLVRLLHVPAYHVLAFWLHYPDRDAVVIANKPSKYDRLSLEHVYPAGDFLRALAQEESIRGVPPLEPA
jgi:hypothetical protein